MAGHHAVEIDWLTRSHQLGLCWFAERAGSLSPFPPPLEDGTLLATRAKGIYKPAGLDYALSIRLMLSSPYADKTVERHADGTWSLKYFQENTDPNAVAQEYTNRALIRCQQDGVPIGVLVQQSTRPVEYEVLGLARVLGWEQGYFTLESAEVQ